MCFCSAVLPLLCSHSANSCVVFFFFFFNFIFSSLSSSSSSSSSSSLSPGPCPPRHYVGLLFLLLVMFLSVLSRAPEPSVPCVLQALSHYPADNIIADFCLFFRTLIYLKGKQDYMLNVCVHVLPLSFAALFHYAVDNRTQVFQLFLLYVTEGLCIVLAFTW